MKTVTQSKGPEDGRWRLFGVAEETFEETPAGSPVSGTCGGRVEGRRESRAECGRGMVGVRQVVCVAGGGGGGGQRPEGLGTGAGCVFSVSQGALEDLRTGPFKTGSLWLLAGEQTAVRPREAGWEWERSERGEGGPGAGEERETEGLSREGEFNLLQSTLNSSSGASLRTHAHHINNSSRPLPPESLLRVEGVRSVIFLFHGLPLPCVPLQRDMVGVFASKSL